MKIHPPTLVIAAALLFPLTILACGGSSEPPKTASASQAAQELVVLVRTAKESDEGEQLSSSIQSELTRSGYNVAASDAVSPDVVVQVAVEVMEEAGLVTIYVDGKPKLNRVARARVSVEGDGVVLETAAVEYDADEAVPADKLTQLVQAVTNSANVRAFAGRRNQTKAQIAREQQRQREEAEQRESEERLAARRAAEAEEKAAWSQVILSACTEPTSLDGCQPVAAYLEKYPAGLYATEAKTALEAGQPRIAALSDEMDWSAANVEACRKPARSQDCDGVAQYLQLHPAGAHRAEAQEALHGARSAIDKLRVNEEREAEADYQRVEQEEKKQARKACEKECLGGVCFGVAPGKFDICMSRCVKAYCD